MKTKLDLDNSNVRLVIMSLVGMIKHDGLTVNEAFEVLDEIKNATWHALTEIKKINS